MKLRDRLLVVVLLGMLGWVLAWPLLALHFPQLPLPSILPDPILVSESTQHSKSTESSSESSASTGVSQHLGEIQGRVFGEGTQTRGIPHAVVLLEGIDSVRIRGRQVWEHPPVTLELTPGGILVRQGNFVGPIGLVQRGTEVQMISHLPGFGVLRGRGANYFARTFPEPNSVTRHQFQRVGLVELTSATGAVSPWSRAHVFVCDHPYVTLSDLEGKFHLKQIPEGDYLLTCWCPNEEIVAQERNTDTGAVNRVRYRPGWRSSRSIRVQTAHSGMVNRLDLQIRR